MNCDELFIDSNNLPKSLTINEINDLFKKKFLGDKEAREKLIKHNIKLVIFLINKKFNNTNYDKKELTSIGMIGLINAVDTFDVTKNYAFSTYASICICNEVYKYVNKNRKYEQEKNLSDYVSTVDSEITFGDIIADDNDMIYDYEEKENYIIVRNIINQLPLKEKEIISLYYGFNGYKRHTIKQIAYKYNSSKTTICNIIGKTKHKIKKQLEIEYDVESPKTKKFKK